MIQFSFSPNWYRPQSLAFSAYSNHLFYASNAILYHYNLKTKTIISELNLKEYLLKEEGYSLSTLTNKREFELTKKEVKGQTKRQVSDNKSQSQMQSLNRKNQGQKQKTLKISAIQLIEDSHRSLVVVGLNTIGVVLLVRVEFNEYGQRMKVSQLIDVSKKSESYNQTDYIYVKRGHINNDSMFGNDDRMSANEFEDNRLEIVVISSNLIRAVIEVNRRDNKKGQTELMGMQVRDLLFEGAQKSQKNKARNQQIKLIHEEQLIIATHNNELGSQVQDEEKRQALHMMVLSPGIISHQKQNNQLLIMNSSLNCILFQTSLSRLITQSKLISKPPQVKSQQFPSSHKTNLQSLPTQNLHYSILSSDSIQLTSSTPIINSFIFLTKSHSEKSNLFCQRFSLISFDSTLLQFLIRPSLKDGNSQKSTLSKFTVEINYPKKCHHKLTQNHKSTLSIKFIDQQTLILTGKLGQIFILNLKQIQLKMKSNPKFVLTLKPYSYEENANVLWFLQPNQKHYKDIYAIYRVKNWNTQNRKEITSPKQHQAQLSPLNNKTHDRIHMMGTDHILTSWRPSHQYNLNPKKYKIEQKLVFQSSVKYLTSAVEQIILSEAEQSLVFLRLKDSNIRSFQPFSGKSYWLNEFWKHTSNSFSKSISRLVMHPSQIGLACMVSNQNKIILYDIYQQRLVKLIEIRSKTQSKHSELTGGNSSHKINQSSPSKDPQKNQPHKDTVKNSKDINMKLVQINSISFEHVSIISALESLYECQNSNQNLLTEQQVKESFQLTFQTFYQRQINKNTLLLIQSNDYLIIIQDLSQKYSHQRLKIYKKIFKLQRIYKTKYWDGHLLLGTRKKKGQLILGIVTQNHNNKEQHSQLSNNQGYILLENKVDLPLGTSSRYLFKVNQMPELVKNDNKSGNKKLLTVINYKGTNMAIIIFELCHQPNLLQQQKPIIDFTDQVKGQEKSQIYIKKGISLKQISRFGEIQLENMASVNSSNISIEHMIMSQEQNQFLIAVYNSYFETITLLDIEPLITSAVANSINRQKQLALSFLKNQNIPNQQGTSSYQKNISNQSPKRQLSSLYAQSISNSGQNFISSIKIPDKALENQRNQFEPKEQDQRQVEAQQWNEITGSNRKSMIRIHQFSGLSYKVQSLAFQTANSCFSQEFSSVSKENNFLSPLKNTSYLIILGKDQSVRLLELYPFINGANHVQSASQIPLNYKNLFKYHFKSIDLQQSFK